MKRIIAVLVLVVSSAAMVASAAEATKVDGWISDSMCGAKHSGAGANAQCVKTCIKNGMKPVFVDSAKKTVFSIDNPDAVKNFYGDHVTVTATVNESSKSVHIDSIAAAK